MEKVTKKQKPVKTPLLKSPTGIHGLDEITYGGLPTGRPTLLCGAAGCGKTLLSMEFLVNGAILYNEPGVFVSFEENENELVANVKSLGFDIHDLIRKKMFYIEHIQFERSEIEETGEYDLEGLFIRLNHAINSIGAKRIVLDTIESLFSGFSNPLILRAELRRLFRWLKDKGVTAIITGERGDNSLTRQGLEEYVSDCVIVLDHRVFEQVSTRRIRVVKYRGSRHETNEFPFLIDESGISVFPITSLGLQHHASGERISTGIPKLDEMLENKGFFKGSSILVSGTPGTGKSSLASHFAESVCMNGEKVLFISLEESPEQIMRNMSSIGINLRKWADKGNLVYHSMRPTMSGLEMHLTTIYKLVRQHNPTIVIIDPINSFIYGGNELEAKAFAMRMVDFLKSQMITGFFTSLVRTGDTISDLDSFISSIIDTIILVRDIELGGERNRGLYILKSRGMAHSNQIREFLISKNGIDLLDVYSGMEGVLTGSSRLAQEARDRAVKLQKEQEIEQTRMELEAKRKALEAKIKALESEFEAEKAMALKVIKYQENLAISKSAEQNLMIKSRHAHDTRKK